MAALTAIATLGAAAIGAGASMSAAKKQQQATQQASQQAADSAAQQLQLQREARTEARQVLTPYATEGDAARRLYNAGVLGIGYSPSAPRALTGTAPATPTTAAAPTPSSGAGRLSRDQLNDLWSRIGAPQQRLFSGFDDFAQKFGAPEAQDSPSANQAAPTSTVGAPGANTVDDIAAARAEYNHNFEASPFWQDAQYSTGQGLNALISTNAALGRGGAINSGKALRAASDIIEGYRGQARSSFNNALAGVIDTGYNASSGIASGGQTFANNASNILANTANLQGQYTIAGANALAGGIGNAAGFLGWGLGQLGQQPNQPRNYFSSAPVTPMSTIPGVSPYTGPELSPWRGY